MQSWTATVTKRERLFLTPLSLIDRWQLSERLDAQLLERMHELFDGLMSQSLSFVKSRCKEYQQVPEGTLVVSTMRLLESLLSRFHFFNREFVVKTKPEILLTGLDMVFVYCLVWSVGASIDEKGRSDFDRYIKSAIKNPIKCESKKDKLIKFEKQAMLPELGPTVLIYDFYVDLEDSSLATAVYRWKTFTSKVEAMAAEETIPIDESY